MNLLFVLWGQVNPMDLGRNFRAASQEFHWSNAVLIAAVVGAIGFGLWTAVRFASDRERRGYRHPGKLFRELCQSHNLDRPSRKLLSRLASAHCLTPARLFLDPERFDTSRLDPSWAREQSQLQRLRETIFGRSLPSPTQAD